MRENSFSDIDFPDLDLNAPAAEQIMRALRWAIMAMELQPGQALYETEIGQRFGASRTPVRSALTQLREQRLVVTFPSRGNYVSKLSEDTIRSAQFVREAMEMAFLHHICEVGLSDDIRSTLERNVDAQAQALADKDGALFLKLDEAFHDTLARAPGQEQVRLLYIREKANLDRLRGLGIASPDHMAQLLQDHRDILDALVEGDAGRAEARLRGHLRDILGKLSSLIAANEKFFDA